MQRAWPYDIAVASVLGGVLALTFALTFGLSPFLWPLLGLVIGPLCYKPGEIASTTVACTSDLWKVARNWKPQLSFSTASFHYWREVLKEGAFCVGCFICLCISAVTLPLLVVLFVGLSGWFPDMVAFTEVCVLMFMSIVLGFLSLALLFGIPALRHRWAMPLSRRVFLPLLGQDGFTSSPSPDNAVRKQTKKQFLGVCLFLLPFFQVGSLLAPGLVLDVVITIALACASTRRIASMLGSTLFCTAAAVAALCGITFAPLLFLIGGIVGWFAGPSLYLLRASLAAAPSTVPIQS